MFDSCWVTKTFHLSLIDLLSGRGVQSKTQFSASCPSVLIVGWTDVRSFVYSNWRSSGRNHGLWGALSLSLICLVSKPEWHYHLHRQKCNSKYKCLAIFGKHMTGCWKPNSVVQTGPVAYLQSQCLTWMYYVLIDMATDSRTKKRETASSSVFNFSPCCRHQLLSLPELNKQCFTTTLYATKPW